MSTLARSSKASATRASRARTRSAGSSGRSAKAPCQLSRSTSAATRAGRPPDSSPSSSTSKRTWSLSTPGKLRSSVFIAAHLASPSVAPWPSTRASARSDASLMRGRLPPTARALLLLARGGRRGLRRPAVLVALRPAALGATALRSGRCLGPLLLLRGLGLGAPAAAARPAVTTGLRRLRLLHGRHRARPEALLLTLAVTTVRHRRRGCGLPSRTAATTAAAAARRRHGLRRRQELADEQLLPDRPHVGGDPVDDQPRREADDDEGEEDREEEQQPPLRRVLDVHRGVVRRRHLRAQ